ncbi:MAG: type-F conjugative transfer system pilin assembly protein TrbC [Proteobacteria bacterium]|nr:type-F conjugative transfer system pilin assembly protein TrbC [Pseudomonadota bacterium]
MLCKVIGIKATIAIFIMQITTAYADINMHRKKAEDVMVKAITNAAKAEDILKNTKVAVPDFNAEEKASTTFEMSKIKQERYESEAKKVVGRVEKLKESEGYKSGLKIAREVEKRELKVDKFKNTTGDIITERGVDLYEMSNRYLEEFNRGRKDSKEKLTGFMVFISASIPEVSLKAIARDVKQVRGNIFLIGMIDGSVIKTAELVKALNEEGVPVAIHPKAFEIFKIESVPAYVLVDKKEGSDERVHDKLIGNVSVAYALSAFAERGNSASKAKVLLKKLRRIE